MRVNAVLNTAHNADSPALLFVLLVCWEVPFRPQPITPRLGEDRRVGARPGDVSRRDTRISRLQGLMVSQRLILCVSLSTPQTTCILTCACRLLLGDGPAYPGEDAIDGWTSLRRLPPSDLPTAYETVPIKRFDGSSRTSDTPSP